MLHVVFTDEETLDALPPDSWIAIVRRDEFVPYRKEYDGTWWAKGGSYELDRDHLVWGAMILFVPGDQGVEETAPWEHPGHSPVQHRDGRVPWCGLCGWSSPVPAVPARKIVDVDRAGLERPAALPITDVPTGGLL
jgi:hypothetical protein